MGILTAIALLLLCAWFAMGMPWPPTLLKVAKESVCRHQYSIRRYSGVMPMCGSRWIHGIKFKTEPGIKNGFMHTGIIARCEKCGHIDRDPPESLPLLAPDGVIDIRSE